MINKVPFTQGIQQPITLLLVVRREIKFLSREFFFSREVSRFFDGLFDTSVAWVNSYYTPVGHFIVSAGHCLKYIIPRQQGNKPTLCP